MVFGYEFIIYIIGELVKFVVIEDFNVYDLGCLLGVVSLFVVWVIEFKCCNIIGVDSL